jgi:carbamoyltransferase
MNVKWQSSNDKSISNEKIWELAIFMFFLQSEIRNPQSEIRNLKAGNRYFGMTKVLGISAFYHDSAAALVVDGKIVAAAQEERFTRKKHDPSFPRQAIRFCLGRQNGKSPSLPLEDLDAVVFYDKPFLKFERLLETYYAFAPRGLKQFLSAIPVWVKEKLFIKKVIVDEMNQLGSLDRKKTKLLFSEHHLSHAASAFYPSPFREAAILTLDGVGEWATASMGHGKGREIEILKELNFPHSLGLLYSAFTYYTGFKVNSGEYKLMGLSPYGDPTSGRVQKMVDLIYTHLLDVKEDGSLWLNHEYFAYPVGLKMVKEEKWHRLFGFPPRLPEGEINQEYCDMAMAIQQVTEEVIFRMAREAKRLTGASYLCLAGGVALNCVANGKLLKAGVFDDLWIQPAAGDAGGALGAALSAYHLYFAKDRQVDSGADRMEGSFLGPDFAYQDVKAMARKYRAVYEELGEDRLLDLVAELLDQGQVVGWVQGRMEWGPRALGNRSILGDARSAEMQRKMNLKIKFREGFRPFAPSLLGDEAPAYFEKGFSSPYMLLIDHLRPDRRKPLPADYHTFPWLEKLHFVRSDLPAITHLDYSARVQTVHPETNPRYYRLIGKFKDRTGYGVILNTSFNVRGEPIVCTPEDAYRCFMRTEMDYLAVGDFLFDKKNQPSWEEGKSWKEEYGLD